MSTYHITVTDDGIGNYTGVLRRGGTAASGGTAITGTGADDMTTSFKQVGMTVQQAMHAIINDRAAGN